MAGDRRSTIRTAGEFISSGRHVTIGADRECDYLPLRIPDLPGACLMVYLGGGVSAGLAARAGRLDRWLFLADHRRQRQGLSELLAYLSKPAGKASSTFSMIVSGDW